MFRLILVTLAALYAALAWVGTPEFNPRPDAARASVDIPQAPQGAVTLASLAGSLKPAAMVDKAPAEIRTVQPLAHAEAEQPAPQIRRFPGPPLEPSPEFAGRRQVMAQDVDSGAAVTAGALTVNGDRVNLRAGPGTSHPSVGRLSRGTLVFAVGPTSGAWIEVRDQDGQRGFVSANLLSPR